MSSLSTSNSLTPAPQVSSQTTTPTMIMSMIRASVRRPLGASGGMPASGSAGPPPYGSPPPWGLPPYGGGVLYGDPEPSAGGGCFLNGSSSGGCCPEPGGGGSLLMARVDREPPGFASDGRPSGLPNP